MGGYVTGERELISYLRHNARGFVFSAAMTPPAAAAALAAFDLLEREGVERRARLAANTERFMRGLREAGFDLGPTQTPVIPVMLGDSTSALAMAACCQARGLFILPVLPPAVPEGKARLRVNVTAAHSSADIDLANVTGVANLLAAAQEVQDLTRLVHVSTTDVYGYPRRACTEDAPPRDRGLPYNSTKLQGETLVLAAGRGGLPVTVLRPANLYGPGSKDFVLEVARLLKRGEMLLPGGGQTRAGLLYVAEAVAGMAAAARSPRALGEVYNLSGNDDLTWAHYVTALAQALGLPPPRLAPPWPLALGVGYLAEGLYRALGLRRRPLLTRHAVYLLCRDQGFPTTRAQADFGFAPATSLAQGLAHSAAWAAGLL